MELRDHYDWVTIGQSPAALLGAALAARQGLAVLIVPGDETGGPVLTSPAELLDHELCFLPNQHFFKRVFSTLWSSDALPNWLSADPSDGPQLLSPHQRIFAGSLRAKGTEVVSASLSRIADIAESYWSVPRVTASGADQTGKARAQASAAGYFKEWTTQAREPLARLHRALGPNDLVQTRGWLDACCAWSASPESETSLALLGASQNGYWVRGGVRQLCLALKEKAVEFGAHLARGVDCTQIIIERQTLTGVQISDKGRTIGLRAALSGSLVSELRGKAYFSSGPQFAKKLKEPKPPQLGRVTLGVTVHAEAIPPGLGSLSVWQEEGAPSLTIQRLRPEDYGLGQSELVVLALSTIVPFSTEAQGDLEILGARMVRKLADLVPYADFHTVRVSPLSPVLPIAPLDPSGAPSGSDSGIERLYLASPESYPGLGTFGAYLAAVEAVEGLLGRSIA